MGTSLSPSVSPSPAPAFLVTNLIQYKGMVFKLVRITLTNYTTGGWPITAGDCGLRRLQALILASDVGYPLWWDHANGKLLAYSAVGTQMTDEDSTLSGVVVYALALGN